MDWVQFIIFIITMGGLFLWQRREAREDLSTHTQRYEAEMREHKEEMREHRQQTNAILLAIQQEIKDFHGRLCAIEERYRQR